MASKDAESVSDALGDLIGLAKKDKGASATSLARRMGLARAIFGRLRAEVPEDEHARGLVLMKVLSQVAFSVRAAAIEQVGQVDSADWKTAPAFQAAAAAELLELQDRQTLEGFVRRHCENEETNEGRQASLRSQILRNVHGADSGDNRGPRRKAQERAAVWIGQTRSGVRDKEDELLQTFEAEVVAYITDHREELTRLVPHYLESASEPTEYPAPMSITSSGEIIAPGPVAMTEAGRVRGVDPSLRVAIRELADRVRRQLEDEQQQDKVTDPFPMPVRWSTADEYPADHWGNVCGDRERSDPVPISGMIDEVADLFASVPSRRLVVIGKGGAGKSVLVRELALALLGQRSADDPVPVVFRMSSWDPAKTSLRDWMAGQLIENYPDLKIKATRRSSTLASRLVQGRHILPILDGLDELATQIRPTALPAVNRVLGRRDQLVLTSRPTEYVQAVEAGDVLTGAAVVELHDLTVDEVAAYLPRTTRPVSPQANETKWDPVLAQLPSASVLRGVLSTPLMAFLARSAYSDTSADPAELLDTERFPDAPAIADHLLDKFIEVKYDPIPIGRDTEGAVEPWRPDQARRWLGFLATSMFARNSRDFFWWHPPGNAFKTPPILLATIALAGMLVAGVSFFIQEGYGVSNDTFTGSWIGTGYAWLMLIGTAAVSSTLSKPRALSRLRLREIRYLHLSGQVMPVVFSQLIPVAVLITISNNSNADSTNRVLDVVASSMLVVALAATLVTSQRLAHPISPPRLLHDDRAAAAISAVLYGVAYSISFTLLWTEAGHVEYITVAKISLAFAVAFIGSLLASASGTWSVRCVGLAAIGQLPLDCMRFLEQAYDRGILRQSGSVYQFRHALMQEQLATTFMNENTGRLGVRRTISAAHVGLVVARFESGHLPNADEKLRSTLNLVRRTKPDETRSMLINVLRKQGKFEEAMRESREFRDTAPRPRRRRIRYDYYERTLLLAEVLEELGDLRGAIVEYRHLLSVLEGRTVIGKDLSKDEYFKDDPMARLARARIKGDRLAIEVGRRLTAVQEKFTAQ